MRKLLRWSLFAGATVAAACGDGPTDPGVDAGRPRAAVSLAVGAAHSCALNEEGAAYCWGDNTDGQLGTGTPPGATVPTAVAGGLRFTAISAAGNNSCALTREGAAYCWGANDGGTLGNGTRVGSNTPVPVSGGLRFASIDVGAASYVCGVTSAGSAYCWGRNQYRQLGTGNADTAAATVPTPVAGGLSFRSVSTGFGHTCGVTTAGEGHCWGWNFYRQLDGVRSEGTVATPVRVAADLPLTSLEAGASTTCGISGMDTYCWGVENFGSRGEGVRSTVTQRGRVAGGLSFARVRVGAENYIFAPACGVTSAGAAYCWGANLDGQLGTSLQVAACPRGAGTLSCSYTPVPVSGGLLFEAVVPGGAHSCGIARDRRVFCWGSNTRGQLGNGTTGQSGVPVEVGSGIRFAAP